MNQLVVPMEAAAEGPEDEETAAAVVAAAVLGHSLAVADHSLAVAGHSRDSGSHRTFSSFSAWDTFWLYFISTKTH